MGSKTKIDWADATWNPVTGCLHGCGYCYARKIANRFGGGYRHMSEPADRSWRWWQQRPDNKYDQGDLIGDHTYHANGLTHVLEEPCYSYPAMLGTCPPEAEPGRKIAPYPYFFDPTFHRYRLDEPQSWTKPRTIFVCSMADLFGTWVPNEWIVAVLDACMNAPQHRYLFLTKNPKRLHELAYSDKLPSGDNFWYGTTVSGSSSDHFSYAGYNTFVSIEPIMGPMGRTLSKMGDSFPNWIIVGAETGNRKGKVRPEREWVKEILTSAQRHWMTPVFMKESLRGIMGSDFVQEFPWTREDNGKTEKGGERM